jgi:hypothetical protein
MTISLYLYTTNTFTYGYILSGFNCEFAIENQAQLRNKMTMEHNKKLNEQIKIKFYIVRGKALEPEPETIAIHDGNNGRVTQSNVILLGSRT